MGSFKRKRKSWVNSLRWRLLDTYILKKFLGSFFYSIALLMTIIVVFDVSENIQRFLDNEVPLSKVIFSYYLNFIPYFINLFIPLFTFISVIWFTSKLSQKNEIIAILGSGVNFYRLMLPYITGAVIIAVLAFAMSNFLIPHTNARLNAFKNEFFYKKSISNSNIHIKNSSNTYIFVERWEYETKTGQNFSYEKLGNQILAYKIKARTIRYDEENEKWILEDYIKRRVSDNGEIVERGRSMDTVFNITPQDLNKDVSVVETMTYNTLRNYIKEEKEKGSGFVKYYQIEQHKRMSNPLGTIIMTLLGLSVASRKTHRGIGVHLFIGMGMAFSFIFFQQVSDVFSVSGNLPPALGAWIPNLIFLVICIVMLRFTQK